jgi:dipeptide/tripeptide permease
VPRVDALLAFAAALLTLRLSGDLVRRYRRRRAPELAAWAAGLGAYSVAAGALAWGAAAGWSDAAFRIYYLGGALMTAALLGVGSLLLVRKRWIAPIALVYVGIAIGVAAAVPLHGSFSGTGIPEAQDVLDFWPARVVAIVGNSLGTVAVVGVALATLRARPVGNVLVLAGIAIGALAPAIAIAAVLLYLGFVAPATFAKPRPHEHAHHHERDG